MTLNDFAKRHNVKINEITRMSGFGRSTLFNWWGDPKTRTRAIITILGCEEAKKYTKILHDEETKELIYSLERGGDEA